MDADQQIRAKALELAILANPRASLPAQVDLMKIYEAVLRTGELPAPKPGTHY